MNYKGRFSETGQSNKVGHAYAQPNSGTRCPVCIIDLYPEKLPRGSTAFYMQPLQKLPTRSSQPWFKNTPVGVKNMMAKVSKLTELSLKHTNHSLRAKQKWQAIRAQRLCDSMNAPLRNNIKLLETLFRTWKHLNLNKFGLSFKWRKKLSIIASLTQQL